MLRLKSPSTSFAVICHDAGGANQIAAMLKKWDLQPVWVIAAGPALKIFMHEIPDSVFLCDIPPLNGLKILITGTGWGSNIEHQARRIAKQSKVRSISVLDHWTNYKERFVRNGETILPDEIWVVDSFAEDLARQAFQNALIVRIPDSLAELELRQIAPISSSTPDRVLYLLEPVRSDWGRSEPGEFQALEFFLENLPALALPAKTQIFLRPHPSDPPRKYEKYLGTEYAHELGEDQRTLAQALSASRWVAGCQTYAMTLALKAGRTVICTLPPWAPPCALPHDGILHLKELAPR